MAGEPESGLAMNARASRWRPLNLQLMRVVLRLYSSPEYDEAEGCLQKMLYRHLAKTNFRDLGRIADEELGELVLRFTCRWRAGKLTGFSHRYVGWALLDLRKQEARATPTLTEEGQERIETMHDHRTLTPDVIVLLEDIENRFRGSLLQGHEQKLFDAWIENANRWGWQREFAQQAGKPDMWVSVTLGQFRERLANEYEVQDARAFVELLGSLRNAEDDQPSPAALAEAEIAEEDTSGEQAMMLRERLLESFAPASRERRLFEDCTAGYSQATIQQNYPDEEELLLRLHQQYLCLGQELASEPKHAQEATGHE